MHFVGQSYKAAEQFATFKSYLALKSTIIDQCTDLYKRIHYNLGLQGYW